MAIRSTCIIFASLMAIPFVHADEKKAPAIVGTWEGTLKAGSKELRIGFKFNTKPDGSLSATMDSIDQGARDLPLEKVSFDGKKVSLELSAAKITYEGTLGVEGKLIRGKWKQGTTSLTLDLKRVEKLSTAKRPQTPKKPLPYVEEEVLVENKTAGVKLAGTLTKPQGNGPFRAAILITGSGAQDRDETLLDHKPFFVLADHLTRQGIAVLRCDDRGTAKSTGNHEKSTTADFATDIRTLVSFLKDRKDIDPKHIGLIGHSEGGLIAAMVAAETTDVAFIVTLAGPAFRGDELLIMQGQALLKAMKADAKALAWQRELQTRLFKLIEDNADEKALKSAIEEALKKIPDDLKQGEADNLKTIMKHTEQVLKSAWMKFFLAHDPRNNLKKVRCPVLALNGANDTQVPAKDNLAELEKTLKAAGNSNVTVREFANLNHLFQTSKTGLPNEYALIEETIAPVVLETIADWVKKLP